MKICNIFIKPNDNKNRNHDDSSGCPCQPRGRGQGRGIGAVLDGLLSSPAYNAAVERTILLGSYDPNDGLEQEQLRAPRNGLTIRYHTREGINNVPAEVALAFHTVQSYHGVSILYGTRRFGQYQHEVLCWIVVGRGWMRLTT